MGWWSCCHERIWNNYVEIQWKSMQVIFIMLLCTQGYNFLGDPTTQHNVWRKTHQGEGELHWTDMIVEYSFQFKSGAVRLFLQYIIKLMIQSASKQYYLGFWAFSQLKSVYILYARIHIKVKGLCLSNVSWVIWNMAMNTIKSFIFLWLLTLLWRNMT